MYNWLNIIQSFLLPPICLLCHGHGESQRDLCNPCLQSLPKNQNFCTYCAATFKQDIPTPILCRHCLTLQPAFDQAHVPFIYAENISYLIRKLKFNQRYSHARLLGILLADSLALTIDLPELIIPVPLHHSRYNKRGFNQAIEISRIVAKQLQIPLDLHSCKRHRATKHQTRLSVKQRYKNLNNAFSVKSPIKYRHVAIVDDVMTTGTTVNELAKVLKKTGVLRVDVWACARA